MFPGKMWPLLEQHKVNHTRDICVLKGKKDHLNMKKKQVYLVVYINMFSKMYCYFYVLFS